MVEPISINAALARIAEMQVKVVVSPGVKGLEVSLVDKQSNLISRIQVREDDRLSILLAGAMVSGLNRVLSDQSKAGLVNLQYDLYRLLERAEPVYKAVNAEDYE